VFQLKNKTGDGGELKEKMSKVTTPKIDQISNSAWLPLLY